MRLKNIFLALILPLVLTSCSGDLCIDADDFGAYSYTVSARYDDQEFDPADTTPQIAPWRDSGMKVSGRPLVVVVKNWNFGIDPNTPASVSAWCPWYGTDADNGALPYISSRLPECIFRNNDMCSDAASAPIRNAPCLLKQGKGLYMLLAQKNSNPNVDSIAITNPLGIVKHLGENIESNRIFDIDSAGTFRSAGGIMYNYDDISGVNADALRSEYANSRLYFKISDTYYNDNSGQYKIIIKSGVSTEREGIVGYLTGLVMDAVFGGEDDSSYGMVKSIFQGIVQNTGFQNAIKILLVLYVAFTGLGFITGNINITQVELLARVFKIVVVATLLNEGSWNFFYNYLFVFFTDGTSQLVEIVRNAGATGPGSSDIVNMMLAPQTLSKLFSLLFIHWGGFLYILLYFVALIFLLVVLIKATIIYLTVLILIGIILISAPIFISFLLFDFTRSFFENWLKRLITLSIQPILLFAGITFMSLIIRAELYSSLGFRVCKKDILDLGPIQNIFSPSAALDPAQQNSIFYWWFPDVNSNEGTKDIPIPVDHIDSDDNFCQAYSCTGQRYPQLPFLDPQKDADRIDDFFAGRFVHFDTILIIFVLMYLLHKFNQTTESIARYLGDTSNSWFRIESVTSATNRQIFAAIASGAQYTIQNAIIPGTKFIANSASAALISQVKKNARRIPLLTPAYNAISGGIKSASSGAYNFASTAAGTAYGAANAIGKLSGAGSTAYKQHSAKKLIDEFYSKKFGGTGSQKISKILNIKGYSQYLTKLSKDYNLGLSVKQLQSMSEKQLNNKLALAKFGKNYKELSQAQKELLAVGGFKRERAYYRDLAMAQQLADSSSNYKGSIRAKLYGKIRVATPDKLRVVQTRLAKQKDELQDVEKQLKLSSAEPVEKLQQQRAKLNEQKAKLEESIAKDQKSIDDFNKTVGSITFEKKALDEAKDKLEEINTKIEKEKSNKQVNLDQDIKSLEKARDKLKEEILEKEKSIKTMDANIEKLEGVQYISSEGSSNIDFADKKARSTFEKIQDRQRQEDYQDLKDEMAQVKEKMGGKDVFSKEYRTELKQKVDDNKIDNRALQYIEELQSENLSYQVAEKLDDIKKGDEYTDQYASVAELDKMIEDAQRARDEMLKDLSDKPNKEEEDSDDEKEGKSLFDPEIEEDKEQGSYEKITEAVEKTEKITEDIKKVQEMIQPEEKKEKKKKDNWESEQVKEEFDEFIDKVKEIRNSRSHRIMQDK